MIIVAKRKRFLYMPEASQQVYSIPTHIMYIGIGVLVALVLCIPLGFILSRRWRKSQQGKVQNIEQIISGEKLKSDIILNAIEDGVVVLDNHQAIKLFNPAAAAITGWPADEALNLDFRSVFHLIDEKGQDYGDGQHPFNIAMSTGKTVRDNKSSLIARSNTKLSVDFTVSPLLAGDQVSGAIAIFRDVSQARNEEHQRAEFISTASHEMRTPVAAIEGYLALALNDKVSQIDARAREYLQKAHSSTQHLGKLFQDLLTSAKAEDGRLVNHPVVVELGTYLDMLTDSLQFAAEKKGLQLEFSVGINEASSGGKVVKPLYYVHVDPDRLREVITNLFDNAVKYTPSGKITIGLTGDKDLVQFFIKDTGGGIPAEDVPHLFQKFYRVDNSATRTIGGTGLGLFICRKIIELYDGRIWVDSELNKGSTFYINLPRLETTKATTMMQAEAANSSPIS